LLRNVLKYLVCYSCDSLGLIHFITNQQSLPPLAAADDYKLVMLMCICLCIARPMVWTRTHLMVWWISTLLSLMNVGWQTKLTRCYLRTATCRRWSKLLVRPFNKPSAATT